MKDRNTSIIERLVQDQKLKRRLRRVVALIGVFMLLMTTDSLKRTASTIEWGNDEGLVSESPVDALEGAEGEPLSDAVSDSTGDLTPAAEDPAPGAVEVSMELDAEAEEEDLSGDLEATDVEGAALELGEIDLASATVEGDDDLPADDAEADELPADDSEGDLVEVQYVGKDMVVQILTLDGATLPAGTTAAAQWVMDADRRGACEAMIHNSIGDVEAAVLNISLSNDGEQVQADGPVRVEVALRVPVSVGDGFNFGVVTLAGSELSIAQNYTVDAADGIIKGFGWECSRVGDVAVIWQEPVASDSNDVPSEPQQAEQPVAEQQAEQPVIEQPGPAFDPIQAKLAQMAAAADASPVAEDAAPAEENATPAQEDETPAAGEPAAVENAAPASEGEQPAPEGANAEDTPPADGTGAAPVADVQADGNDGATPAGEPSADVTGGATPEDEPDGDQGENTDTDAPDETRPGTSAAGDANPSPTDENDVPGEEQGDGTESGDEEGQDDKTESGDEEEQDDEAESDDVEEQDDGTESDDEEEQDDGTETDGEVTESESEEEEQDEETESDEEENDDETESDEEEKDDETESESDDEEKDDETESDKEEQSDDTESDDEEQDEEQDDGTESDDEEDQSDADAVVYLAGSYETSVNGSTVTLSWPAEAEIPEDVVIVVAEIERGTAAYDALYNQALAMLPEADEADTQVLQFFDITLYDGETVIEPKAPVSVSVRLDEAVRSDVSAVHYAEDEPVLVDATAEGKTISFEAESFSTYGLAYTKPAVQVEIPASVDVDLSGVDLMEAATVGRDGVSLSVSQLLTGEDDGVSVTGQVDLTASQLLQGDVEASGVEVQGGSITLSDEALNSGSVTLEVKTSEIVNYEKVVTTHKVEINLTGYAGRTEEISDEAGEVTVTAAENNSLPRDASVSISDAVTSVQVTPPDESAQDGAGSVVGEAAYDITITNGSDQALSSPGAMDVTVRPAEEINVYSDVPAGAVVSGVSYTLTRVHGDEREDIPVEVVLDAEGTIEEFRFTSDRFSGYTLSYTVDFAYTDPETGASFAWSFAGRGRYAVAEIMSRIGLSGDPEDVSLVCVEGEEEEGALYLVRDDQWWLASDIAFDEVYVLTLVIDGRESTIIITDEPVDNRVTAEVYFLNPNGTRTSEISTESGNTLDARINLSNSNANDSEDVYVQLSLEGLDDYVRLNEQFTPNEWDSITFRDMTTNKQYVIGVYYNPDNQTITYKIPPGATGIAALSFTAPNGITENNKTLTMTPTLVDDQFNPITPAVNDVISDPASGKWTSTFNWDPVQKRVNGVKENTVVVKYEDDVPVIDTSWLHYDYTATSLNRAETGVRWTEVAVIEDTLTLPEHMSFGGSYTCDADNGRIYINGAPEGDNNPLRPDAEGEHDVHRPYHRGRQDLLQDRSDEPLQGPHRRP